MNLELRKMALQAAREAGVAEPSTQKLEKFAELIVRECADIALREEHDPYECILNHFGVK